MGGPDFGGTDVRIKNSANNDKAYTDQASKRYSRWSDRDLNSNTKTIHLQGNGKIELGATGAVGRIFLKNLMEIQRYSSIAVFHTFMFSVTEKRSSSLMVILQTCQKACR